MLFALTNIDVIGWVCFVVGILLIGLGVFSGFRLLPASATPGEGSGKIDDAKQSIEDAKEKIDEAKDHFQPTLAAGAAPAQASDAASQATASAEEAKSALEQVQGILSALPENLRFSALLILIGTVLMSVATIQFGQTSLF